MPHRPEIEEALEHGQVDCDHRGRLGEQVRAEGRDDHASGEDRRPIGGIQPGKARYDKVKRVPGPFQRHEDDKAGDREEQVDPVHAGHELHVCRQQARHHLGRLDGIVKQNHRQRGHSAQTVEFPDSG
jgi:hypothetical protein